MTPEDSHDEGFFNEEVDPAKKILEEQERERLERAYKHLTQTIEGMLVLHDILSRCGILRTPYSADQYLMNFKAGEQNVGLYVIGKVPPETVPALLAQQLKR